MTADPRERTNPPLDIAALRERLGFVIEERAGVRVLQWREGGCQPASVAECLMWDALAALSTSAAGEKEQHAPTDQSDATLCRTDGTPAGDSGAGSASDPTPAPATPEAQSDLVGEIDEWAMIASAVIDSHDRAWSGHGEDRHYLARMARSLLQRVAGELRERDAEIARLNAHTDRWYADKKAIEVIDDQRIRIAALESKLAAQAPVIESARALLAHDDAADGRDFIDSCFEAETLRETLRALDAKIRGKEKA